MKKNTKSTVTPKLRFPEFRGDGSWEAKPLSDLSDRIVEKVGDTQLTPVSITAGRGFVSQVEKFGRDISGAQYKNYFHMRRGDFAYNKGNSNLYPQGCVYRLKEFEEAAASNAFICFRLRAGNAPGFLEGLFEKNAHGQQLAKFLTSGARSDGLLNIRPDEFFSVRFSLPPRSAEQKKIADCLSSLDEVIRAQARKVEALKAHKRGLMRQLFPREGETLPRVRFPEFRDAPAWQETTLGQLVDFRSGGTPSKANPEYWNGTIPWVSAKDMKRLFLEDTEDHITAAAVRDGAKRVPAGTVLMLTRGMTLLNDVPICILRREMSFNQDVKALRPKGDLGEYFLPYLLQGNKRRLLRMVDLAGHGTGRLNTDELMALDVMLPRPAEQRKIADCLYSLDGLIPAESERLDALRAYKNGLMQRLFPSQEERL
ncbi:restriction endonuclease subunit S [Paraburkholderia sacchari]|uniref:restriction endonuclease subunit S n=1 Tax=Paraburkholderia sacchari TaxID=159450 RepID=UPI000542BA8D|nr:restriction endonuclease subunit S [Paraburkholderia sacchari]NLP61220.1 restriction endonuclease subunit S [Paraburkholderia sacchari]